MLTDAQLTLSDNQAITADAASTNQIDLSVARNLARSGARTLRFVGLVTTTFLTTVSLTPQLRMSAAANMGSPIVLWQGAAVLLANLTAGKKIFDVPWPDIDPVAALRYLDAYYDMSTDATAGAIWAGVVMDDEGGELRLGITGLTPGT